MLEYHKSFSGDYTRSHKVILMVVRDPKIGAFFMRAISRETKYHVILVSCEHQALKIIQEVKLDLFVFDYALHNPGSVELYEQFHAIKGLEGIPAILSNISNCFTCYNLQEQGLRDYEQPSELESFLFTVQEVLT